jgi:hypothetical protein
MPWQNNRVGLAEACLDGIKANIVNKLADLTTILAVAPAIALGPTGFAIDASFIRIGDPDKLPDDISDPFWITIVGGGRQDGRDTHVDWKASGPQFNATVWHNIYLYVHPDTFPGSDVNVQAETRERFRARVQDWLTWDCFNNLTNVEIPLVSQQFAVAPNNDKLTRAYVSDVSKGYVMKSFGQTQWLYMAHFLHEGMLLGGSG